MAEPLKRGDLYFVKPPGFVGKVRPAVIVQADRYNSDPPSVTVCLLTSHLVDEPAQQLVWRLLEQHDEMRAALARRFAREQRLHQLVGA